MKTQIIEQINLYKRELKAHGEDVDFFLNKLEYEFIDEKFLDVYAKKFNNGSYNHAHSLYMAVVGEIRNAIIKRLKFTKGALAKKAIAVMQSVNYKKMPTVCANFQKMGLSINCPTLMAR